MSVLAWIMLGAVLAVGGSAALSVANLRRYRRNAPASEPNEAVAASTQSPDAPLVSVCVPARNEEANIGACVRSLLAQDMRAIEVVVYDDQSTDATPGILAGLAAEDPRVRLAQTSPLPGGWNGKQHACWRMSAAACGRWLLFTDADMRFEPACLRTALEQGAARGVGLLSTFPRQIVGSIGEALLVPMIFFLLFSYLPMGRMRRTRDPSASAGCGQFLLVRRDAYEAAGTHEAFKDSMHDGIMMPRAVRRAGFATDLFDATGLCSVRMYRGLGQTWRGFAKNAYEGLGSVGLLVFLTVLHVLGHVLPWLVVIGAGVLLVSGPTGAWPLGLGDPWAGLLALLAIAIAVAQRAMLAVAFRHPIWIAVVHPVGVAMMTLVQWHSFALHITGRRAWRGRVQGRASVAGS
ncbi:MAG: glycosyltransferase [Phycisphaerales bacterium]|nr:glycosyltransferase [Phycisphaerales bacterium]